MSVAGYQPYIAHRSNEQSTDGELIHAGGTHHLVGPRDNVDNGGRGASGGSRFITGTVAT